MSDAYQLWLNIGPLSMAVRADREAKGISELQLTRKWEAWRALRAEREERRRKEVGVSVDCRPWMHVECRRSST